MKSTYVSRPLDWVPVALLVVLAIGNILSNRIVPDAAYVPTNLLTAAAVYVIGRQIVTNREIGFAHWRWGLVWGAAVLTFTIGLYLVGTLVPTLDDLYRDRRVHGRLPHMLYAALVRIPLGTVVLEELAFRGVLPAVLGRRWKPFLGAVVASLLFGLWHVLPALSLSDVNPILGRAFGDGNAGRLLGVAFAISGTFVAGMWLCFLRYRSGSILAPMIAHVSSNSLAYAMVWILSGGGIETHLRLAAGGR